MQLVLDTVQGLANWLTFSYRCNASPFSGAGSRYSFLGGSVRQQSFLFFSSAAFSRGISSISRRKGGPEERGRRGEEVSFLVWLKPAAFWNMHACRLVKVPISDCLKADTPAIT
ncbi:hypothetical protein TWF506_008449 [Arthrobotrys conoides]|uniref:Uncharacterized protein n=1 Tax=Arthrobotrys conoides TaxID=74498 RepID=A0AAN8NEJ5_9PEZI